MMRAQITRQRLHQLGMFVSHTFMHQRRQLLWIPLTHTQGLQDRSP
jgi:hypothetical protein